MWFIDIAILFIICVLCYVVYDFRRTAKKEKESRKYLTEKYNIEFGKIYKITLDSEEIFYIKPITLFILAKDNSVQVTFYMFSEKRKILFKDVFGMKELEILFTNNKSIEKL